MAHRTICYCKDKKNVHVQFPLGILQKKITTK